MYIEKNDTIKLLDQTAVRISDSGYAIVDCEWIMDQLPSNFSRLYFICSGEGEISYAGQTVILRPCHMYLIPPGLQFEYGCENSMEKIFFHISVILQNNFDLFDNLSKCYELPLEPGYTEKLIEAYRTKDIFRVQAAIHTALARFSECIDLYQRLHQTYSQLILDAFRYIEANLSARLTVKEISSHLMVSVSSLSKRFHTEVGCSTSQYIDMLIMQKAKYLLQSSDLSIGQIADQLHFCDRFYFARFFRKHAEETPSLFRRRYAGKR